MLLALRSLVEGSAIAQVATTGGYAGPNIAQFYKAPLNKKTKKKKKAEPEAVSLAVPLAVPAPIALRNDDDEVALLLWLLN